MPKNRLISGMVESTPTVVSHGIVPAGMTTEEFDVAVLHSAMKRSQQVDGSPYFPGGGTNSNNYIYRIITGAGGKVPDAARPRGSLATGLCGGTGIYPGTDCKK